MFKGRIDRIGFLLGIIYATVPLVASIFLYAIINLIFNTILGAPSNTSSPFEGVSLFQSIINIALFALGAAPIVLFPLVTMIRRWHDIGQTGWLAVLYFVPYVSFVILLILLFTPGDKKKNIYGKQSSPRGFKEVVLGNK